MKRAKIPVILVWGIVLILCFVGFSPAEPLGTAFNYQGRLIDSNSPADGLYDFEFALYDGPKDGNQIGSTVDVNDWDVIDGYFTVALDFGSEVFDGNERWLEIGVRPGELDDPNVYNLLSPRQKVMAVPYSLYSLRTQGLLLEGSSTLVGVLAGAVNSGVHNTFLGYQAGWYNTTGTYNTFSGSRAGRVNTTGESNTFSGYAAGYFNTTGSYNTFSGYTAGRSNTTGEFNTFSGHRGGYSNTTGTANTYSGALTGYYNTTGNYNTFLGYRAGYTNATGSGNIFIGYKAGYNEKGSNQLYIANSDANNLIYGDFSTGKVGIGTTTPAAKLDVAGDIAVNESVVINSLGQWLGDPTGLQGPKGDEPAHQWSGTRLRFQKPDGTWGTYVDLRGPAGPQGPAGPAVSTSAVCVSAHDIYDGVCSCAGQTVSKVTTAPGGGCSASSDTGTCSALGGGLYGTTGQCCVCAP